MRLQEQLQGFVEYNRDRRGQRSGQKQQQQRRRRSSRDDAGGRYADLSDDDDEDDDEDDDDIIGSGDDADEEDEAAAAAAGGRRRGGGGSGRQLQQRVTRQQLRQQQEHDEDEEEEEEDEDDEEEEEEEERAVRKRYQLRSRERQSIQRYSPRHVSAASAKPSGGASVRGSGERRRDRDRDRHRDRHRERDRERDRGGRHNGRRGSGFGDGGSSSDEYGELLGRLRGDGAWGGFMAAAGAPGPYYTPGIPPNALSTPAAAVAAAAAAAATGLISPGRGLDRRGSCLLGDTAAAAADPVGSGWGHWGGGSSAAAAAGGGVADGLGPFGGVLGRDAAATAGGREGRVGLGQELITPLQVDASIGFDQVGGLDQYLAALKEMIFLPLLYPELFEKFGVQPPRGVLFHGPPGTGKTLVARALAAQASKAAGQKVSFFMRKGADLLSKWVGEAEKQLRLLFEEAARCQPAIIFFDEIDGLAPVRTSKQDQVHNSIVSTLLALMDGLESRGRVVLIGATNRPDALDPALRRPGRFDRELLFPLPDLAARRTILGIHSRAWSPPPAPGLLDELARLTVGYCGADIKALCAEASLAALRRVYPQVYDSDIKLLIDPAAVVVAREDFMTAMQGLTPAAHRATSSHARALNPVIEPCLATPLQAALLHIQQLCVEEALVSTFTEARRAAPAILYWPQAHLWWAAAGSGLRCALIALLDDLPPDLPLLLLATAELATDPAAAAAVGQQRQQQLRLAAAAASSSSSGAQLQQQQDLEALGIEPSLAALFPALGGFEELLQSPQQHSTQQQQQQQVAAAAGCGVLGRVLLGQVGPAERRGMFKGVLDAAAAPPPLAAAPSQQPPPPELPQAPEAAAAAEAAKAAAAAAAARAAYEQDQAVLRSLRVVLRSIASRALAQKRYRLFAEPPLPDEAGGLEALQALSCPMDLLTMLYKVDHQQYLTPAAFLADAHLIVRCAEELYGQPEAAAAAAATTNPAAAAGGADIAAGSADAAAADAGGGLPVLTRSLPAVRVAVCKEISRAIELRDELETQVYQLLPPELVRSCEAIAAKGGPAPPPPGMTLPQHLLPPASAAAAAARGAAGSGYAAAGAGGRFGGAAADGSSKPTRSAARLTGRQMDKRMMHADPEALMRALKARPAKPKPAAAEAEQQAADKEQQGDEQQQQAEEELQAQQQQQAAAGDDVEMADVAAAEQTTAADAAPAVLQAAGRISRTPSLVVLCSKKKKHQKKTKPQAKKRGLKTNPNEVWQPRSSSYAAPAGGATPWDGASGLERVIN
ncbi:hypothetical protein OEZ85_011465 [Tetradesmus obliquus]|uniref:AAA+ ATPase domain-containing protein n=1 Tax=Tetradesmus obliquus TaxID=3088 RepID=A0ABY8TV21_TETOB|nr:hypothetical protein OEZ85_011465 [Tetradesmus obliquus]